MSTGRAHQGVPHGKGVIRDAIVLTMMVVAALAPLVALVGTYS